MGWLITALVLFGAIFLAGLTVTTATARAQALNTVEFMIMMLMGTFLSGTAGVIIALFPLNWAQTHYNERSVDCFVKGKDRGGKDNDMRIYTSCGVFQNTDSILRGKNTSADVWSRIEVGKTQTFHVVGWRLGLTSDFPNVLGVV